MLGAEQDADMSHIILFFVTFKINTLSSTENLYYDEDTKITPIN